jgi:hypothetical protein
MTTHSKRIGFVAATAVALPLLAAAITFGASPADASTCTRIAGKLASQNQEVQRILRRDPNCMRKHANHSYSLQSKSKAAWQGLCDKGTASSYLQLASNRDRILRTCIPRGSHD